MAHLIDFSTGHAGMAYVGKTPWHGLGEQLQPGAPLEVWGRQAGMSWQIREAQLQSAGFEDPIFFPTSKGLFRSDNHAPLSIVGADYKVVQPGEVLEFFRDLTESGGFALETAGCLDEGRKFWALARTGMEGRIGRDDNLRAYLLLASSCDGSMATTAQFTSVRVVCNNTLRIAVRDTSAGAVKVRHRSIFDAAKVKDQLGLLPGSWDSFMDDAQQMAETPIIIYDKQAQKERVKQFLCEVFGGDPKKELDEQPNKRAMLRTWELFTAGDDVNPGASLASAKGTVWGLVNSVTRFVDFERRAQSQSNRLESAWFGPGADVKSRAWEAGLKLAA